MAKQIFISYTGKDFAVAQTVAKALASCGWSVWLDDAEIRLGDSFNADIQQGLSDAKCVVVLWSSNVASNSYMVNEAREAQRLGKYYPLLLPASDATVIPVEFRNNSHRDLSGWDGSALAPAFQSVVNSLAQVLPPPQYTPPQTAAAVDPIVAFLNDFSNVNFFIGQGVLNLVPSVFDMTMTLLEMAEFKGLRKPQAQPAVTAADMAWVLATLETAASYAQISFPNRATFEKNVRNLLAKITNPTPEEFDLLCQIAKKLIAKRGRPRQSTPEPFVIVTTRIDCLLERAFVRNGLPFTRMVPVYGETGEDTRLLVDTYRYEGDELGKRKYRRHPNGDPTLVFGADIAAVDQLVSGAENRERVEAKDTAGLLGSQRPQPVIYKLCGSLDIEGTYVLSRDHEARCIARNEGRVVPDYVSDSIKNSPCLLLGYCQIDADFSVLKHTFLPKCRKRSESYVIASCPAGRSPESIVEKTLWERMRGKLGADTGATVVEIDTKVALHAIAGALPGF